MKDKKRYSDAFKLKVMEELRDGKWKTVADVAQAYGVSETGVRYWMKTLGFEHLNGRMIYVKTTSEIDEIKRLKAEVRQLKERLAGQRRSKHTLQDKAFTASSRASRLSVCSQGTSMSVRPMWP